MKEKIRIGCGAGFSGDRLEPALILAEKGGLDFLVLECLAERTIALAQKRKLDDPSSGYDPLLEQRMQILLPVIHRTGITLISNMGAANPEAAADKIVRMARDAGLKITVAAVTGDDVLNVLDQNARLIETGERLASVEKLVSANAYMGVDGILEALAGKADIIITGRVADPSLFVAPMVHEFGWELDDYDRLGKGTVVGHLMECAGQITGGYFADPGKKDVPGLATLGHPFADVSADGSATIGKVDGTGGVIDLRTAKEQLLYEVINPSEYYTPDVVADFTTVRLREAGFNTVAVSGGSGKAKPETYKVSVGYQAFFLGEGEMSYGGANAVARATLAGDIIRERLAPEFPDLSINLIGMNSLHGKNISWTTNPYEVRLRVVGRADSMRMAQRIGEEVEALYTNGPAGGGGARKYAAEVIGIVSTLLDRKRVKHSVSFKSS